MKHPVILCMVLLVCFTLTAQSQGMSGILETMEELELRLENLIKKEAVERKKQDLEIKKSVSKQTVSKTTKPDDRLQKTIEELKIALLDVRASQKKINNKLTALSDTLTNFSEKGDDERISTMAIGLKNLIGELKEAMTPAEDEQELMELGGIVTVDLGMNPSEPKNTSMEVGTVELSAVVNIASSLTAFIALLAEGNLGEISIDQALVEWTPEGKPISAVLGQQTFNHALLSTHLISDPLLLDNVEIASPGLTANFSAGQFRPGIGFTVLYNEEIVETGLFIDDSMNIIETETITQEEAYIFAGIFNLDAEFMEESMARLSLSIHGEIFDLALGGGLVFDRVAFDFELYTELLTDDNMKHSGYYSGLSFGVNDNIEIALRYDGLSEDTFKELEHRVGLGATFSFKHGLFCALEYAYDKTAGEDGANEIALQFGLESTLKLPGFQRRTLTKN